MREVASAGTAVEGKGCVAAEEAKLSGGSCRVQRRGGEALRFARKYLSMVKKCIILLICRLCYHNTIAYIYICA